jgi:hypothetical protein
MDVGYDTPEKPERGTRRVAWSRRRLAAFAFAALTVSAIVAALVWWFASSPLKTATEWGGTRVWGAPDRSGLASVILGIRTENAGRFDVRVTGVEANRPAAAAELQSVGIRSSPTAPRVESFAPFTLNPGERIYLVLSYEIFCEDAGLSAAFGGIDIRYEVFGFERTRHIGNPSSAVELSPARACRE